MQEIWKDVLDYEGLYQISNLGRIKSIGYGKETILKPRIGGRGYYYVNIYRNGKRQTYKVHRLVYEAFKGKTNLQIDHISEGNKLDNRLCNLQAISCRQNISKHHLTTEKSSRYIGVTWRKDTNKWRAQIQINGKKKHLGTFISETEAANAYQNALKSLT